MFMRSILYYTIVVFEPWLLPLKGFSSLRILGLDEFLVSCWIATRRVENNYSVVYRSKVGQNCPQLQRLITYRGFRRKMFR